jgi:hypothetical protein
MRAGVGNEPAVDRAVIEGAGSMAFFASKRPPPKPMARMTNVVPTPTKNARAFDAMMVTPVMPRTLESRLRSGSGKIRKLI